MSFVLDPVIIAIAVVVLLIGLWLGRATRGGLKRQVVELDGRARAILAERDMAIRDRDAASAELAATLAQLRPLAEEVDRYKRQSLRARPADEAVVGSSGREPAPLAGTPGTVAADDQDVRRLKGVGDRFAAALAALGVTRVGQVAAWSTGEADAIDARLPEGFRGRIATDRLVEQAQLLDGGRVTEYETRFGRL